MGPNKAGLVNHRIFPSPCQRGVDRAQPTKLTIEPGTDRVPICYQHPRLTVCNRSVLILDKELYTYPKYVECGSSWPQQDSEVCLCARRSYAPTKLAHHMCYTTAEVVRSACCRGGICHTVWSANVVTRPRKRWHRACG